MPVAETTAAKELTSSSATATATAPATSRRLQRPSKDAHDKQLSEIKAKIELLQKQMVLFIIYLNY